jgi:hypothetical protein
LYVDLVLLRVHAGELALIVVLALMCIHRAATDGGHQVRLPLDAHT